MRYFPLHIRGSDFPVLQSTGVGVQERSVFLGNGLVMIHKTQGYLEQIGASVGGSRRNMSSFKMPRHKTETSVILILYLS